jgi:hydrogenase 3 maturation protease
MATRKSPRALPELAAALEGVERLAVLGVGSELRGDDYAGVRVAQKVALFARRAGVAHLAAFEGCAAPENVTGPVAAFKPTHLLLVDAAHLGIEPGEVRMIPTDSVAGVSFSTHMLPAPIVLDYLVKSCACTPLVVGIQPEQTDVLGPISPSVAEGIDAVVEAVKRWARRRPPPSP